MDSELTGLHLPNFIEDIEVDFDAIEEFAMIDKSGLGELRLNLGITSWMKSFLLGNPSPSVPPSSPAHGMSMMVRVARVEAI